LWWRIERANGKSSGGGAVGYGGARLEERRVRVRHSERVVLECTCGERLVLLGPVAVRCSEGILLECGCGEVFTLAGRVNAPEPEVAAHWYREARRPGEERHYSWLEGCLERLEGREAREEYYVRLEHAVSW
jgi:hypothetical protein